MKDTVINTTKANQRHIRALVYGAICLAMSVVLGRVMPVFRMPNGGSITIAALAPLFLYVYLFGIKYGLLVTIAYTLIMTVTGSTLIHPWQVVFDYVIPYMALAVITLVPKVFNRIFGSERSIEAGVYIGVGLFALIRWASQTFVGMFFFLTGMQWRFSYEVSVTARFWGSLLYNSFGIIDAAIAAIVLVALFRSKAFCKELGKIQDMMIKTKSKNLKMKNESQGIVAG